MLYRLPTDAEWSIAVGLDHETGDTPKDKNEKIKGVYPWGTQWPPPQGAGNYSGEESMILKHPVIVKVIQVGMVPKILAKLR